MWKGQPRSLHSNVAKPHDVEIDCSRTPSNATHTAECQLDPVQTRQQHDRRFARRQKNHLIQVRRLRCSAERRGLLDACRAHDPDVGARTKEGSGAREEALAATDIRAERDENAFTHESARQQRAHTRAARQARRWPSGSRSATTTPPPCPMPPPRAPPPPPPHPFPRPPPVPPQPPFTTL